MITESGRDWSWSSGLGVEVEVEKVDTVAFGEDTAPDWGEAFSGESHSVQMEVLGSSGVGLPHLPLLVRKPLPDGV